MRQQYTNVKQYMRRRPNDPKRFSFCMPRHQKRIPLQLLHSRQSLEAEAQSESLSQAQAVIRDQERAAIVEDPHAGAISKIAKNESPGGGT